MLKLHVHYLPNIQLNKQQQQQRKKQQQTNTAIIQRKQYWKYTCSSITTVVFITCQRTK